MDFMEYLRSIFGDIFGDLGGGIDQRRGMGNYYDAPDNRMRSGGDGGRGGERMTPPGFNPNMPISRPTDGGFGGISRPNDGPGMGFGRPMVPPGLGFNPPNRPMMPPGISRPNDGPSMGFRPSGGDFPQPGGDRMSQNPYGSGAFREPTDANVRRKLDVISKQRMSPGEPYTGTTPAKRKY
jgi:hypothetical protein